MAKLVCKLLGVVFVLVGVAGFVAPGFLGADALVKYSGSTAAGWLDEGKRNAVSIPLTPYLEVRAAARDPAARKETKPCGSRGSRNVPCQHTKPRLR